MEVANKTDPLVKRYASKVLSYLLSHSEDFQQEYATKLLQLEVTESRQAAIYQGQVTGNKLSQFGAKNLGHEIDNMIASSSVHTPTDTLSDAPNGVPDGHSFVRVPSDLTDDYHPLRNGTYHLDEYSNYSDDTLDQETLDMAALNKNIIGDEEIDLIGLCHLFKSNTLRLRKEPQQISDLRLLALHDIYLFDINKQSYSVGKDWSTSMYRKVIEHALTEELSMPSKSTQWCLEFSLGTFDNWKTALAKASTHLSDALASDNIIDIHTIQAIMQLLPLFIASPLTYSLEDTYVHNWIAPILKPVFDCEPLLCIEWANRHIYKKNSDKTSLNIKDLKPDFAVKTKGVQSWVSVVVGEFKKPGFSPGFESDLVKIGKEMRLMLNVLVCLGVPNPSVGGILVQGRQISTFKLEVVAPKLYRMVKLCELTMFDNLGELVTLPVIVSRLHQVKQIGLQTALKVETLMNERSSQMRPSPTTVERAWISHGGYKLRQERT